MKKSIPRQSKFIKIPVLENNRTVYVDKKELCRKYGVYGVVRLPKQDFAHFKKSKKYVTHFNLQWVNFVKRKKYALVMIVKPGFFDGKKEALPVLSFKKGVIAECLGVRNMTPYDKISKDDFKHSFKHIKSVPELKKAILRRYKKSMPRLSEKEILSLGVSVSKFKILKRIPELGV